MDGNRNQPWLSCGIIALAFLATTGCTTMQPQAFSLFGQSDAKPEVATPSSGQTFVVELHPANGQAKTATVPWKNDLHVQEALKSVNGYRRFSRFNVELHRQLPQGGMHRMVVDYAKATQQVEPEFDYVIHPGDKLVITESDETMIDDALNAVLAPIGMDRMLVSGKGKKDLPPRYRVQD